jgi:hypothetical protein
MKPFNMTRQSAGTLAVAAISLSLLLLGGTHAWSDDAVETIVLVRHGEKPDKGLGQLDCQGLNRALALPPVIAKTFGRPTAAFAPDPSQQREDDGVSYDYVRPLATIEPTAIFFGLPINASFGSPIPTGCERPSNSPLSQRGCHRRLGAQAHRNHSTRAPRRTWRRSAPCAEVGQR